MDFEITASKKEVRISEIQIGKFFILDDVVYQRVQLSNFIDFPLDKSKQVFALNLLYHSISWLGRQDEITKKVTPLTQIHQLVLTV